MKNSIKKIDLNIVEKDIYSLVLFSLYKVKDIPEYSVLSELSYTLDKDNFLRLCEYFGGMTITIPTIEDLQLMLYSLLLYQYVDIEHIEYDEAVKLLKCKSSQLRKIRTFYSELKSVLDKYEITYGC